jgi:transmembrane sensor
LRRWLTIAASVLVTVAAAGIWYYALRGAYATDIGEQRSLRLDDGSTVELNARSRIKVRYTANERHIDLLEGQALFHVAKNKARPFIVQTGDTRVRAVGTRFDVYRKHEGTVVTVIEGQVAVAASAQPDRSAGSEPAPGRRAEVARAGILLAAGEQLTVPTRTQATAPVQPKPQPANIAAVTAWTQRRLIFNATPLAEVVEEFNRYNPTPLVITDPTLAATGISGSFSSSDPASLLRFLREVGPYTIRETGTAIEISRK